MACVCTVSAIAEFCGGVNAPGLDRMLSLTCSDQVASIPAPGAGTHTISTNITMETTPDDGVFFKWYFSKDESSFTSERDDNGLWKTEVKIFVAQLDAEKSYTLNGMTGDNVIALVKDRNGKLRLIGDKSNGAQVKVKETTTPKSGYEVTIMWESAHSPYYYTGTIAY